MIGNKVDEDAKKYGKPISYIYIDKNQVIYTGGEQKCCNL